MKKLIILPVILVAVAAAWTFKYINGKDFKLYNEAKKLEAQGDIYGAHEKISEALQINPKNRKVISYKTELYFLVKNDSALKEAYKGKEDAERAREKGDYSLAAKRLAEALAAVDSVSSLYERYSEAEELQKELIKDVDRVLQEAPERYYLKGLELYGKGEYERAYGMLEYISDRSPKVIKLMDDIAYKVGCDKYRDAETAKGDGYIVRDAISWLEKVSASSPDLVDAKARISRLKSYLKN